MGTERGHAGAFVSPACPDSPLQDHETTQTFQHLQPSTSQPGHCCQQDAIHTDTHTHSFTYHSQTHTLAQRGADTPHLHTQTSSTECLVKLFVPVSQFFTVPPNTTHTWLKTTHTILGNTQA